MCHTHGVLSIVDVIYPKLLLLDRNDGAQFSVGLRFSVGLLNFSETWSLGIAEYAETLKVSLESGVWSQSGVKLVKDNLVLGISVRSKAY